MIGKVLLTSLELIAKMLGTNDLVSVWSLSLNDCTGESVVVLRQGRQKRGYRLLGTKR